MQGTKPTAWSTAMWLCTVSTNHAHLRSLTTPMLVNWKVTQNQIFIYLFYFWHTTYIGLYFRVLPENSVFFLIEFCCRPCSINSEMIWPNYGEKGELADSVAWNRTVQLSFENNAETQIHHPFFPVPAFCLFEPMHHKQTVHRLPLLDPPCSQFTTAQHH